MKNPIRRNRNIGTVKQGHGQNNCLEIPESWHDSSVFFERLVSPVKIKRMINGREIFFFVEPTLSDFRHSCTIDDIQKLIELLPPEDVCGIAIIVLRQPTRKQTILDYPWGRLAHFYEFNNCRGAAIVLEAQELKKPIRWSKSICPQRKRELDRLEDDGHRVVMTKRCVEINSKLDNCRNTQLFRTVPHEVGHHIHYQKVNNDNIYSSLPIDEKETFAHRYADEFKWKMEEQLKIPFPRILCEKSLQKDNLNIHWFKE